MPDGSLRSRFRTLRAGRGIAVHCLLCCSLMLGYSPSAHAANIITFDPPGSVSTDATAINSLGAITGAYFDTNGVGHAFVRNPDGTFTTFNAPPDGGFDPFPSGISDLGLSRDPTRYRSLTQGESPRVRDRYLVGSRDRTEVTDA